MGDYVDTRVKATDAINTVTVIKNKTVTNWDFLIATCLENYVTNRMIVINGETIPDWKFCTGTCN